jgi:hypothetical protein
MEGLQITEYTVMNTLSQFRMWRLITMYLLSRGRKEVPLTGKIKYTSENRALSVQTIHKRNIPWFLF